MAAPRAEAQCPGSEPAFSAVVNEQPQLLQACRTLTPEGGCATPSPLVVDVSRTHAQEATLEAAVPSGFTATSSHWLLERWNGSNWTHLWTHESIQGAPMAGGSAVSFGAPGLVASTDHRARVSFCDDKGTETSADDECFCWSSPVSFTTTAFEEPGPAPPPAPMLRKVQDRFDRPNTNPKCRAQGDPTPLGDGLGPPEVWADCVPGQSETVRIVDRDAWTTPSSEMVYTRQWATHPDSYAQMQVRVDNYETGGFRYNLQVGTRLVYRQIMPGVSALTGYYLKLVVDARDCANPTMMLVRLPAEHNAAKCDGTPFPYRVTLPSNACDPNADPSRPNKCDCAPPLDVGDPDRSGYSKPVWMRVEAWDVLGDSRPHFTGGIAWGNCPTGEPMSTCQFYCAFPEPRLDTGDPQSMLSAIGTWGAYFHEKNYAVEVFDAGSKPAP